MTLDGCTALITGASAGLGWEFARQLGSRAACLVLVARRQERLETLRNELIAQNPDLNVHIRQVDLTQPEQLNALCNSIAEQGINVDVLINNSGLGDHGPFATSNPERVNRMLQLNIVGLTALTLRVTPAMIARRRGAILNVSSTAGFLPLPGLAIYAASKAYVTSFSEALRGELRGTGVSVTALCPGPVHTEFSDVATRRGLARRSTPEFMYVSAEKVVRAGLRGLEANQPLVIPGIVMKLAIGLARMTPMPLLRLLGSRGRPGP